MEVWEVQEGDEDGRCARLRPERSTHGGEEWVWYKRVAFVLRIE